MCRIKIILVSYDIISLGENSFNHCFERDLILEISVSKYDHEFFVKVIQFDLLSGNFIIAMTSRI